MMDNFQLEKWLINLLGYGIIAIDNLWLIVDNIIFSTFHIFKIERERFYMNIAKAIDKIYNEREKFIIIGLTGRTGSGCTTVSKILQTEKFSSLSLHQPKTTNYNSIDERKYQIVYSYAQNHWHHFYRISMTDIIFSFIIQFDFDTFLGELENLFDKQTMSEIKETINDKYSYLKDGFNYLNQSISTCIDDKNNLFRDSEDDLLREKDILVRLSNLQSEFREIMQNRNFLYKDNNGKSVKANMYTYFLQEFGNRIRHHGDISSNKDFTGNHMFALAKRANDFIKAIRYFNKQENVPTFICLDAIRRPTAFEKREKM